MATTTIPTTEISTKEVLRFINCFRDFSRLPLEKGQLLISDMLCSNTYLTGQIPMLQDQWRAHYNRFGEFWLGLSASVKISFLRFWMFKMEGDDAYVNRIAHEPRSEQWIKPPVLVRKLSNVIKFFEEHRIDDEMADAIDMPAIPTSDKQEPGAVSWANFIASWPPFMERELHETLATIRDFYPKIKLRNGD